MISLMILTIILQKSSYCTKFLHHSIERKVTKVSQLDKPAVTIMSKKQSKHKMNTVNTTCRGQAGN